MWKQSQRGQVTRPVRLLFKKCGGKGRKKVERTVLENTGVFWLFVCLFNLGSENY